MPNCNNFSLSKTKPGLCNAHYQHKYHGRDPFEVEVRQRVLNPCIVNDCPDYAPYGKVCTNHYKAIRMGQIEVPGVDAHPFPHCSGPECDQIGTKVGLCPAHYAQKERGIDLKPVIFQRQLTCEIDECENECYAHNKCTVHYWRYYHNANYDRLTVECQTEGCESRVKSGRLVCVPCVKDAKREARDNAIRVASETSCAVTSCGETCKPWFDLCISHARKSKKLNVPSEFFVKLMESTHCEACGSDERMVTDHRHGHHESSKEMCSECIRGRLCNGCNTALGYIGESEARLEGLLAYIKRFDGDPIRSGRPEDRV